MVVEQPLKERRRFRQIIGGKRPRFSLIVGDRRSKPVLHRLPVEHRGAHLIEDKLKFALEPLALRVRKAFHMNMHEAFAQQRGGGALFELDELAFCVPADVQHWVKQ